MNGSRQRILRATTAALSWQPQGADGEPTDPGTVTVQVARSDGTEVLAAGTATAGTGSTARTVTLTPAQTATLDVLTVTWTAAGTVVATTNHEIVGGFYFTVAEVRGIEPSLADAGRDLPATIIRARDEIETLIEQVCRVAFVPRFSAETITAPRGGCQLIVGMYQLRRVRWARLIETTTTSLATEVAGFPVSAFGGIRRTLGWGCGRVEIGYEHGYDAPPADLKRAAITAVRAAVNQSRSGVPDRATSMQLADGGSVTLATPGIGGWHTGIPSVDEVINRYRQPGEIG